MVAVTVGWSHGLGAQPNPLDVSVRRPLPQPEPTHGSGSATQWRPWTPAMAAGLTDHVWTLREVLLFRVPPWPQPAGV